jgi:hypothetical protein
VFLALGMLIIVTIAVAAAEAAPWWESIRRFDAPHYEHLCRDGYAHWRNARSEVAFFPAFPLAGRVVTSLTGLRPIASLALVANLALLAAMGLFVRYLGARRVAAGGERDWDGGADGAGDVAAGRRELAAPEWFALAALAVFPTTFFFRLPYAESLFLLVGIAALYGMERRWPLAIIALVVGLATAVRPVGVALLLPLAWHLVTECRMQNEERRTQRKPDVTPARRSAFIILHSAFPSSFILLNSAFILALSLWGLAGYMLFQYMQFDDPLAFARTQQHWQVRGPTVDPLDKVVSLVSGHAVWSVYDPGDAAWWGRSDGRDNPQLGLAFFNPIYFVLTVGLVILGGFKRWLTRYELLLSAGLLLIPYVTKGYENGMLSHARFAAVVFPAYIVLGQLLSRVPRAVAVVFLFACAGVLGWYTHQFAAGHPLY